MRRTHPLHPSALLIDEHGGVVAAERIAEGVRQRAQLLAIRDVALEQYQAPRARLAQERALVVAERRSRAAADESARHAREPWISCFSPRSSRRRWLSAWCTSCAHRLLKGRRPGRDRRCRR